MSQLHEMQLEAQEIRRDILRKICEFEAKYQGCTLIIETVTEVLQNGKSKMVNLSLYVKTETE